MIGRVAFLKEQRECGAHEGGEAKGEVGGGGDGEGEKEDAKGGDESERLRLETSQAKAAIMAPRQKFADTHGGGLTMRTFNKFQVVWSRRPTFEPPGLLIPSLPQPPRRPSPDIYRNYLSRELLAANAELKLAAKEGSGAGKSATKASASKGNPLTSPSCPRCHYISSHPPLEPPLESTPQARARARARPK